MNRVGYAVCDVFGYQPGCSGRRSQLKCEVKVAIWLAELYPDAGRHLRRGRRDLSPDVWILVHGRQVAAGRQCSQPTALNRDGNGACDVDDDSTRILHGRLPDSRGGDRNWPGSRLPPLERRGTGKCRNRPAPVAADDLRHRHLRCLLAASYRRWMSAAVPARIVAIGSFAVNGFSAEDGDHRDEETALGQRDQHRLLAAHALGVGRQSSSNRRIGVTVIVAVALVSRLQFRHFANCNGALSPHPQEPGAAAAEPSALAAPKWAGSVAPARTSCTEVVEDAFRDMRVSWD